jgi:hypothetical protein
MKSNSLRISAILLALSMVFCISASSAQPAPAVPTAPPAGNTPSGLETRAYDVRDLLLLVQDYPLGGAIVPLTQLGLTPLATGGGGGGQIMPPTPPAPGTPLDQLKKVLTDGVDPLSWKDNGGTSGWISSLNGQLFITQTAENQAAVRDMLTELRKGRAVMVRIRADWVLLPPGKIDQLLKNGADDKAPLPEINRDALDKVSEGGAHYSGQISCFSGQTVHLASGRAQTTVTQATPVVASQAVAYESTQQLLQYGLSLQVMPAVSSDSVTLDLLSIVSGANAQPTTQPVGNVDRINAVVQHFHTTAQVPLNKPVLVGGMTINPATDQPDSNQLFLIVEADAKP